MKLSLIILCLLLSLAIAKACTLGHIEPNLPAKQETVILLHGLVRSNKAMNKIEQELKREGYTVINHDYPSKSASIEDLSEKATS